MNAPSPAPTWRLEPRGDSGYDLSLAGNWTLAEADRIDPVPVTEAIHAQAGRGELRLRAERLGRWDSLLLTFLIAVIDAARTRKLQVDTQALPEGVQGLLTLAYAVPERSGARREDVNPSWLAAWGESAQAFWEDARAFTRFLGEVAIALVRLAAGKARFRVVDLLLNMQECGPNAVPIVALISILVGLILAFVGAVQLALFGAEIYIADLVALGMSREMGALMTAIIMSGRTGAAFAAQIGTMNVNLELSALKVMGFEPMEFLVLPRMLALILVMPVLALCSIAVGILGGGIVTVSFFDVSLTQYLIRTQAAVGVTDFTIGLLKCTVFGILIAFSGCLRGMQCGRSASAVGDAATSAVVTSIVLIVVADSVMTLICNRLGI